MAIVTDPNSNIRIFRPSEIIAIQNAIPRTIDRERFDFMLYTGCRYNEFLELYKMKHRFNGEQLLRVRNTKAKVKEKNRDVRLSDAGVNAVKKYFKHEKRPPTIQTWDENLVRWCDYANIQRYPKTDEQLRIDRDKNPRCGIYEDIISAKSLRKTCVSWLMNMFPQYKTHIYISIGHTERTSIKHYLGLGFNRNDKRAMIPFVKGWDKNIGYDWSELEE